MKKYKLHYAPLDLDGDIPVYEFDTVGELIHKITSQATPDDVVFLVCLENKFDKMDDLIFVHESIRLIEIFIDDNIDSEYNTVFCFLMDSYEEAYKMALEFREPFKLCYAKNKLLTN